ncbi:MAG: 4-phosphoerythronate dehydrogenase [Prevotella sp.]
MKIIVDDKIPYIREALSRITRDILYIKGADITADDVRDADALVVRTRTRCDRHLLEGSKVRFVATATIGIDHLDTQWLDSAGIRWVNCPGCNASSVGQYLLTSLISLQRDHGIQLSQATLGIVGLGHVGREVKAVGERLGMRIIVNDPFLDMPGLVNLDTICRESDIITFHVPLTFNGPYPTYHLADRDFLMSIRHRGAVVVNTSRGGIIDEKALLESMHDGVVGHAIIDTWENEPDINHELLREAYIATPHIAGYSADGKVNADNMVLDALCSFFGIDGHPMVIPPSLPQGFHFTGNPLELYDPMADSQLLKSRPEDFEEQRGNYRLRREKC